MVEHRNLKRASTKNTEPQEFETWNFIAVKSFFTEKEFGKNIIGLLVSCLKQLLQKWQC